MTEPRRHHFLSQCYLKGFTADGTVDGKLYVVNVSDGSTFETKPINVGVERDFNAVEGMPPGELERGLSKFEGVASAALNRIIATRSLANGDDWWTVLNLIALFAVHNPRWRNQMTEFSTDLMRKMMSLALATPERWASQVTRMKAAGALNNEEPEISYEEMRAFHEKGEYDIRLARGWLIGMELKSLQPVLETMADRKWTLCLAPADSGGFITCDHPVCLIHEDGTLPTFSRPLGHALQGSALLIPISRGLLGIGTFGGRGGVVTPSDWQMAYLNGIVAVHVHRQIYAANDQFKVLDRQHVPVSGQDFVAQIQTMHREAAQGSSRDGLTQ